MIGSLSNSILECIRKICGLCVIFLQNEANGDNLLVNDREKYQKFRIRTLSTVWMIGGFILIVYLGHLYIWGMIVVIQIFMAKELFTLAARAQREKQLPGFRLLNWFVLLNLGIFFFFALVFTHLILMFCCRHFFFTAMVYVYGRFLSKQLVSTISSDRVLTQLFSELIKYHMLICYFLYIAGEKQYAQCFEFMNLIDDHLSC